MDFAPSPYPWKCACTVCRCKTIFPLPSLKTMSVKS